ncbi:PIG-L family deacetylase, partial [Neisseria sp. P0014.S008]
LVYFDITLTGMRLNPEIEINSTIIDTTDVDIFSSANTSALAKHLKPGSSWNSLVVNLGYLIETFQPYIFVTPSPNFDTHPVHQHT